MSQHAYRRERDSSTGIFIAAAAAATAAIFNRARSDIDRQLAGPSDRIRIHPMDARVTYAESLEGEPRGQSSRSGGRIDGGCTRRKRRAGVWWTRVAGRDLGARSQRGRWDDNAKGIRDARLIPLYRAHSMFFSADALDARNRKPIRVAAPFVIVRLCVSPKEKHGQADRQTDESGVARGTPERTNV